MWSPKAFVGDTHVTEPERERLARLREWGLVDAFRELYDDDRLFTYWDYRRGDFHQHRGMRIDLALVTRAGRGAPRAGRWSTATPARASSRPTTRRSCSTSPTTERRADGRRRGVTEVIWRPPSERS